MTETEFLIVKSIGFAAAFAMAAGFQRLSPHRTLVGSWQANSTIWAIDAVVVGAVCMGCACTVSRWASASGLGFLNQGIESAWIAVLVGVFGMDLVSYFWHRANHRFSFLWRFHQAHHSDPDYTVTTALRFHPGELLLALPLRLLMVAALGLPVMAVIVFEVIFAFSNFFEHGNINIPHRVERALGRVVVTPALHRRHHSRELRLLNTNYGTIFSFWDRLFGSYGSNRSEVRVETGLPGLEDTIRAVDILALPVRGVFRGS